MTMCDYCDCRSEPEIAALSAEHEHMLSLTARIRRATAMGEPTGEVVAELAEILIPHSRREERGVFAALTAEGIASSYIELFESDHDALEALLSRSDDPRQPMLLVELLEAHILREETDLFPAAHQVLGSRAWAAMATETFATT
jgi:iron-sulfur cluster repair protein YtfE (RIC family)